MNPELSLTDRSTWILILTVVAAVLSDIFHQSFASYVPAAATVAAGLVVAGVLLAKHHYAGALAQAANTGHAVAPALQAAPNLMLEHVGNAIADASSALLHASAALKATTTPPEAPTGAQTAAEAPLPPPAASPPAL